MEPRAPHSQRGLDAGLPSPDALGMILLRLAYTAAVMVVVISLLRSGIKRTPG